MPLSGLFVYTFNTRIVFKVVMLLNFISKNTSRRRVK